jgi:hypothetical protein
MADLCGWQDVFSRSVQTPLLASTHSQGMLYTPIIVMPKLYFLVEEK